MGEKEEGGIVNITKRSKDDDDDYGSVGNWQGRLERQAGSARCLSPGWSSPALPCSERRRGGGKPGEEEPGGKEEGAHISFLNRGFCSNSSELK